MEKKVYRQTDRKTNIITEKAKTIYPLYTSYWGGGGIITEKAKTIYPLYTSYGGGGGE